MNKAVVRIDDGYVENVIVVADDSSYMPDEGYWLVDAVYPAQPGATWNGHEFIAPPVYVPTRLEVLMQEGPAEQVWDPELATFEDGVWSDGDWEDRPPEDVAADKAELLALLHQKLAKSQYSSLSMQEMNRMLKLERE